MTFLQAVFSFHSIMCFFYGCSTFFHPEVTVELGLAHRDWLRRENSVLIQLHGACVLGLGLVAISAAQFEYADPRNLIAKCMLGLHILLSYAMLQDYKPGGQTQTPVMVATAIMSFLYSICCSLCPDKDPPTATQPPTPSDKKTL